jgi:Sulfotransferase domain
MSSVATSNPVPGGRLPDFFVVGHPKSGTTALHTMLCMHPQVCMPIKEPLFFAEDVRSRYQVPRTSTYNSLRDYLSIFDAAGDGQITGEASPEYLASRTAPTELARLVPNAKIIALFREPAAFLYSLYVEAVNAGREFEHNFRDAILSGHDGVLPRRDDAQGSGRYLYLTDYTKQLRRYHRAFGAERVLTLIYDDYLADNEATVRRVWRFLELPDDVAFTPVRVRGTRVPRRPTMFRWLQIVRMGHGSVGRIAKVAAKVVLPRRFRRNLLDRIWTGYQLVDPPPAPAAFMAELRGWLTPEVQAFGDYLKRDLIALWGYDHT